MTSLLFSVFENGGEVIIVTRPPSDYGEQQQDSIRFMINELKSLGFKVVERSGIHQKFAVMDGKIVWYGSINLLSYGKSEESMMRFINSETAVELQQAIEA